MGKVGANLIKAYPQCRVFAFHGSLGAGKTMLIKAICHELGVLDTVTSPTFTIVNEYERPDNRPIYHFDFYRISSLEEVMDIGYEEYFFSGDFCFIEWPEKVKQLLPEKYVYVTIKVDESTHSRKIFHRIISS